MTEAEIDLVNEPPHYKAHPSGVEAIEITSRMMFCPGNAIKYLFRAGHKGNREEDLKKAAWYLRREADRLEQTEEWRPSISMPGYAVSSLGRVWRWGSVKPRKLTLVKLGYPTITSWIYVHALVAEVFLGPRPAGYDIGHIDGNKQNNAVHNLKYCTRAENMADKQLHCTIPKGEQCSWAKLNLGQVTEIRRLKGTARSTDVAKRFNVSRGAIRRIWDGRGWREHNLQPLQKVINADPTSLLAKVLILINKSSAYSVQNFRVAAYLVESTI